jgi:hypothetical protein
MSHYAKVNNEIVEQVIVAEADFFDTFVDSSPGEWIQTSFNNNIRKQFAGRGFTYDRENDIFIEVQPFPSWTLDGNHDWQPPTPMPDDDKQYYWNEDTKKWFLPSSE